MPKLKLTDAAVERLKAPEGGRVDYFDTVLPGFGVRVSGKTPRTPEGRRSWFVFFRHKGEQKRLTIDPAYPVQDLATARQRAREAMMAVAEGRDPSAEKARAKAPAEAPRKPDTLADVVTDYLKRGLEKKDRAPAYVVETRRSFDNHVLPRLGLRELKDVTRRDVIAMVDAIAEDGTTRRTPEGEKHAAGGPIAANRVLSALRALCNWGIRRGLIDANPCALVERPGQETPRERVLSADELRELWPRFQALGYPFGPFLQVTLLTGQRRSEVANMRWADLDLDARTWTLGADQTKAGRGHVVPLSNAAVAILRILPRKTMTVTTGGTRPSPFVFTTEGDAPISGFSRAKYRVDSKVTETRANADIGAMVDWGIHDLRRTAATEMGRLGTPEFVIGRVLNHAAKGITGQVYNRYEYLTEKRHALDTWARYLDTVVNPQAGNVLELRA